MEEFSFEILEKDICYAMEFALAGGLQTGCDVVGQSGCCCACGLIHTIRIPRPE